MVCRPFRRERRLTQAAEFKRVFDQASRVGNRWMTVLGAANDGRGPRLGLAVAKRRIKLSVRRNRLKRIVRESFRHHLQQLDDLDLVVLAGPAADQADARQLRQAIDELWPRIVKRCAKSSSS